LGAAAGYRSSNHMLKALLASVMPALRNTCAEHALVVGQHVSCDCVEDGGTEDGDGRLRYGGATVAPAGCVRWGADEGAFWEADATIVREGEGEDAIASSVCGGCVFAAHLGGISGGDRVLWVGRLVVQACVGPRLIIRRGGSRVVRSDNVVRANARLMCSCVKGLYPE
jgi:hypothetical protein